MQNGAPISVGLIWGSRWVARPRPSAASTDENGVRCFPRDRPRTQGPGYFAHFAEKGAPNCSLAYPTLSPPFGSSPPPFPASEQMEDGEDQRQARTTTPTSTPTLTNPTPTMSPGCALCSDQIRIKRNSFREKKKEFRFYRAGPQKAAT